MSPPSVSPNGSRGNYHTLWAKNGPQPWRGIALCRERGWLVAWADHGWVFLFSASGQEQARVKLPGLLTAVCAADDGSAVAALGDRGEVWWLGPDLATRWELRLGLPGLCAALDSFGQYLAVGDQRGSLLLFDKFGRRKALAPMPRPLAHLSFCPTAPFVIGAADFGLVACLDLTGRLVWRDGLVAHVGSLAVSVDSEVIDLACFSEGIQRYSLTGNKLSRQALPDPVRLVAGSFEGNLLLAGGLTARLHVLDGDGAVRMTFEVDRAPAALVMGPLANPVFLAENNGPLLGLELSYPPMQ